MIHHEGTKDTKGTKERGFLVSRGDRCGNRGPSASWAGVARVRVRGRTVRELWLRGLCVESQVPIRIEYKGQPLKAAVRIDLLVEKAAVVEVKAVEELAAIHRSQLLTCLKVTGYPIGLLINFNVRLLRHGIRRVLRS